MSFFYLMVSEIYCRVPFLQGEPIKLSKYKSAEDIIAALYKVTKSKASAEEAIEKHVAPLFVLEGEQHNNFVNAIARRLSAILSGKRIRFGIGVQGGTDAVVGKSLELPEF